MSKGKKFIVITNPDDHGTGAMEFDGLAEALEYYYEFSGYGSAPILAQALDVKLIAEDTEGNPATIKLQGKPLSLAV